VDFASIGVLNMDPHTLAHAITNDLECVPLHRPPLAILRVSGALSLSTAPQLRAAALKCLADQPVALMIDAEGLTAADDVHLTVFIAVARHAAGWPSVPVLLCAPQPEVAAALLRLGVDRHLIICATVEDGWIEAANQRLPAKVHSSLLPVPAAAQEAREVVAQACEQWGLRRVESEAGLVITELVSNAVRHAGTPIELMATRGTRHLHLAVRDDNRQLAELRGPAGELPGGRGLLIVEALTTAWGCFPTRTGKVTWASLALF
jgi:anti-anti-sigma regulatory factor/anti-sigma regulatory factor (Ser/Thr protein kinase)